MESLVRGVGVLLIGDGEPHAILWTCYGSALQRTPQTVWKCKKIGHWKMNSPGWQVPNMLLEISREITSERMTRQSQSKNNIQLWMWLVIEAKSNAVKQYCIGTWNVKSMSQGKLEVVKWDVKSECWYFRIRELKWTGMGEFNSDERCIYYCGQESLRRNGVAIIVNKRVWNAVFGCNLKNNRMISVCFQGKPFNITVIQVYAPTSNAEEAEVELFYEDPQDLLELTPKKMTFSL